MRRINWPCVSSIFPRFLLRKDICLARQGYMRALCCACNFVRRATVTARPVVVNIASLAFVVTRWKGSDASFLVQVGKIGTNIIP